MPNGFFIIINDEQVNAFAMKKNDISVVAINAGSIKKIMYSANLMMLSDKILLGIGDMSACRENIIAEEYPITEDGDNVLLYISGDSTREAVGYMIANLAVRFMLYHEIEHHEEGHVKRFNDKYSLFCKEVSNDKERIELEERKKMEFEADMYAMTQIVNDFEILAEIWGKVLNLEVTYSEMFQLLVPALVIVKENLCMDVHNNEQIENSFYLPNIIRVVIDFAIIFMDKKVKKVLCNDNAVMFETGSEYRHMFEKENNLIVFDSEGMLTATKLLKQFESLENVLANAEQIDKPSIRKSVIESRDRLRKNYQIIKLTDRAEITFILEQLKYSGERFKTNDGDRQHDLCSEERRKAAARHRQDPRHDRRDREAVFGKRQAGLRPGEGEDSLHEGRRSRIRQPRAGGQRGRRGIRQQRHQ